MNRFGLDKLLSIFTGLGKIQLLLLITSILALFLFPFVGSYFIHILVLVFLSVYLAQCWNILSGFTGQFSFGHVTFFGLGAYASTVAFTKFAISPWIGMLIGGFLAMLLGLFIGFLCFRFRVRGVYLALVTLGFAELIHFSFINWEFVNAAIGIVIPLSPSLSNFQFIGRLPYLYIIFFMMVGIMLLTYKIRKSFIGTFMISIRENEDAAESIGVNTFRYKLVGFAISAFFTALGGTFYAQYYGFIDPDVAFPVMKNLEILMPAVLGGFGSVWGPLLGSSVIIPVREFTRPLIGGGFHMVIFGVMLIFFMIYRPKGLISFFKRGM